MAIDVSFLFGPDQFADAPPAPESDASNVLQPFASRGKDQDVAALFLDEMRGFIWK
jgi:hypothetical protein